MLNDSVATQIQDTQVKLAMARMTYPLLNTPTGPNGKSHTRRVERDCSPTFSQDDYLTSDRAVGRLDATVSPAHLHMRGNQRFNGSLQPRSLEQSMSPNSFVSCT